MAQDRGGLQYRIVVRDDFSKATKRFRTELEASRKAFAEFKLGLASDGSESRAFRETTLAARNLARAQRDLAVSTKARAVEAKKAKDIDDLVIDAALRAERARAVQNRAEEVGFNLSKKVVKQKTLEQQAQAAATKFAERAAVTARRNQILAEQGIQTSKKQVQEFNAQKIAVERLSKALRDQAIQRAQLQAASALGVSTRGLAVEEEAQRRVEAALRKKALAERFSQLAAERGLETGKKKIRQLSIEEAALKRVEQRERARAIQARVSAIEADRFIGPRLPSGGVNIPPSASDNVKKFTQSLAGANREGNNLLFTFRRLFGVLALFQGARLAISGFLDTIRTGIDFNNTIKTAEIGIASLISAVGQLRDEFGNTLKPAQALAAAQQIARKQTQALRQDALKTTATFSELLDTFQVAIAPGLTGGLNLDQVREFSLRISQAAGALGIAQNQLSEEIRSILSGTIQARTTRIATALGITNDDIRRAKEANQLFGLLQDRFKAFEEAADKAARGTFTGLFNLIRGVFEEGLGKAAQPLFETLIRLGNVLFDQVLTVRDELGNVRPNPQLVAIFEEIFDVLRDLLGVALQAGKELGFKGALSGVKAFGAALRVFGEIAIGATKGIVQGFIAVSNAVRGVADFFGVTNKELATFLGQAAAIAVPLLAAKSILRGFGLDFAVLAKALLTTFPKLQTAIVGVGRALAGAVLAPLAAIGAAVTAVGLGFKLIVENIFDVKLGITDFLALIAAGLEGALISVAEVIAITIKRVIGFVKTAFTVLTDSAENSVREIKILLASLRGDEAELIRLNDEKLKRELEQEQNLSKQRLETEKSIASTRAKAADQQLQLEGAIAKIVGDAAAEDTKGPGFDVPSFDFDKFLGKAEEVTVEFGNFEPPLSTANQAISQMADELKDVQDQARKAAAEFKIAFSQAPVEGIAGQIEQLFAQSALDSGEKARQISASILTVQQQIAAIRDQQGPQTEQDRLQTQAQLNSLLTDEKDLLEARQQLLDAALQASISRAATIAARETPALVNENQILAQRARAEQAITRATIQRFSGRQQELVQAANALRIAQAEQTLKEKQLKDQIAAVQVRASQAVGDEAKALNSLVTALQQRLTLEQQVGSAQQTQLAFQVEQLRLVQSGNTTQGIREGLVQLAGELPTFFEAGVNIAKTAVQSFSSFLSQSIVQAFDPSSNTSFEEVLGRFLQGLAQTILDNLIQAAIGQLISSQLGLTTGAAVLQSAATTLAVAAPALQTYATTLLAAAQIQLAAASVGGGLAEGGQVGGGVASAAHAHAKGYRKGGKIVGRPIRRHRPRGLDPRDTVPIWAQRGEWMMKLAAVRTYGSDVMAAINNGMVNPLALRALAGNVAPGAVPPPPTVPGYAEGGLISDQAASSAIRQASAAASPASSGPVRAFVVANDREADTLLAGGSAAMKRWLRDNRATAKAILDGKG